MVGHRWQGVLNLRIRTAALAEHGHDRFPPYRIWIAHHVFDSLPPRRHQQLTSRALQSSPLFPLAIVVPFFRDHLRRCAHSLTPTTFRHLQLPPSLLLLYLPQPAHPLLPHLCHCTPAVLRPPEPMPGSYACPFAEPPKLARKATAAPFRPQILSRFTQTFIGYPASSSRPHILPWLGHACALHPSGGQHTTFKL
ncbi:hypothetical protein B0H16DRAFT_389341 [Mycena metata]|uniref:Uncharacterized protein n=1 Tax=Mycena metata TaxID=1033252 RepID=A0AAD7MK31_9AGAR|nr:hypothetical protein B0H16DRAFT_389341 [Mycena metata]